MEFYHMLEVQNIKCNKKGADYPATVKGTRLRYVLDDTGKKVTVYTPTAAIGAFSIERFKGGLSPTSIRELHA